MTKQPRREHADVLREALPLAGDWVLGVGRGDGAMVRLDLLRRG